MEQTIYRNDQREFVKSKNSKYDNRYSTNIYSKKGTSITDQYGNLQSSNANRNISFKQPQSNASITKINHSNRKS